jgi:hypothetical protein
VLAATEAKWWKRTWVVQEVFAAQELQLQWGHQVLPLDHFHEIAGCKELLAYRGKVNIANLLGKSIISSRIRNTAVTEPLRKSQTWSQCLE